MGGRSRPLVGRIEVQLLEGPAPQACSLGRFGIVRWQALQQRVQQINRHRHLPCVDQGLGIEPAHLHFLGRHPTHRLGQTQQRGVIAQIPRRQGQQARLRQSRFDLRTLKLPQHLRGTLLQLIHILWRRQGGALAARPSRLHRSAAHRLC
jgi:hypothetical protein